MRGAQLFNRIRSLVPTGSPPRRVAVRLASPRGERPASTQMGISGPAFLSASPKPDPLSPARAPSRPARYSVHHRGNGGLHRAVGIRGFTIEADEPPALGGEDKAPNPVECAPRGALHMPGSTYYRLHGDALGIPLNDVSVAFQSELDLRGFLGAVPGVRSVFQWITGSVNFSGSLSAEEFSGSSR